MTKHNWMTDAKYILFALLGLVCLDQTAISIKLLGTVLLVYTALDISIGAMQESLETKIDELRKTVENLAR